MVTKIHWWKNCIPCPFPPFYEHAVDAMIAAIACQTEYVYCKQKV